MYDTNGYLGFTFAGHHSSEFGLLVVSDGSRYHQNFSSNFNDTVITVPGKNGGYYFGTQLTTRDFNINCAFDDITSHTKDKIQQWLYPNKTGWLIFDETPYKKYFVKVSQLIDFPYLPFEKIQKKADYYFNQDILKGEISISFSSFSEYGIGNENYELPKILKNNEIPQHVIDSGLIPNNFRTAELCLSQKTKNNIAANSNFYIYNAGNGIATADFYFWIGRNEQTTKWPIEIYNYDNGESYIINNFTEGMHTVNGMFMIQILGSKQEVWAYGQISENSYKIDETTKKNIGGYYNHYYPKIYHKKPTEMIIVNRSVDSNGNPEQLYFPFTIVESNEYFSSDSQNRQILSFEEFPSYWSDYLLCSKRPLIEINNILTPNIMYTEYNNNYNFNEELVYLIYPNKFYTDNTLLKFTPIYENSYI